MRETERVIDDLNVAKLILFNPQMLTPEMCIRIGRAITNAIDLLKEQEAVEPKTGYWIESKCLDECFWVCSECNFPSEAIAAPELYKYCPNCGTKMAERR